MQLIYGIWMRDGQAVGTARLRAMGEAMQPASSGRRGTLALWSEGSVGLGLLCFGADAARSLVGSAGGRMMAADVHLHEPDELRNLLGNFPGSGVGGGLDSLPGGDAELVGSAFDRYGDDAPEHLLGDFALAVWDPGTRALSLARDAAGVRPLVYHDAPGKYFLFASFARALHATGLLPRELNPAALLRPVLGQFHAEETLSAGVLQVLPGSTLRVSAAGLQREVFWQPALQARRHKDPAEAAEELRSLLDRAVRGRIRGGGPVAAHLSGGLDSSTLAILAARALREEGRGLLGYSFVPAEEREGAEDETPFVESVLAQEPDIRWKPISPPPLAAMLGGEHDADRGFSLVPHWPENAVCADAADAGADLVLSGWGGDEGATYNGRGVLAHAFLRGRWLYLAGELEALKRERGFRRRSTFLGDVASPILPSAWFAALQRARGRGAETGWDNLHLLAAPWRERLGGQQAAELALGPDPRRNQLSLLRSPHIADRAGNWAAIGANFGLAFSFPLLDRRVLEWALSLPPHWHLRGGWKRRLLRDATGGVLPEKIRWRHGKLAPYPDGVWQFVHAREIVLRRAEELSGNPAVRALFDTERLLDAIRALPSSDQVGTAAEAQRIGHQVAAIAVALGYSEYVAQYT